MPPTFRTSLSSDAVCRATSMREMGAPRTSERSCVARILMGSHQSQVLLVPSGNEDVNESTNVLFSSLLRPCEPYPFRRCWPLLSFLRRCLLTFCTNDRAK